MIDSEQLMQAAIDVARVGMSAGQSPFGCAIALDGKVVAISHNTVWATHDTTAHAEINAIRQAECQRGEVFLTDAVVASTCEPCPMCMSALHWARVGTVYYGARIADATTVGFNELDLPAAEIVKRAGGEIELYADILGDACRTLFTDWRDSPHHKVY